MTVVFVEHFDTDDSGSPFFIIKTGKGQAFDFVFPEPVHGEAVSHSGEFPLKFVQHGGGKMGTSNGIGCKQGNFPFVRLGRETGSGSAGAIDIVIGNLFIAHLDRLFQNAFPCGVGKNSCIVDCFGYRIAGNAQFIRNILNRNAVCHERSHPFL